MHITKYQEGVRGIGSHIDVMDLCNIPSAIKNILQNGIFPPFIFLRDISSMDDCLWYALVITRDRMSCHFGSLMSS